MKWRFAAFVVSFLMVAATFAVMTVAADDSPEVTEFSPYENYLIIKEELDRQAEQGVTPSNIDIEGAFSYTDGPFPTYENDGSAPSGPQHMPWGSHYISDAMYAPPHNPGYLISQSSSGGLGNFAGLETHESWIGDLNGNGIVEWLAGFSYRPWGEDNVDNDGDGCVDEKAFGIWDGQVGCDRIPDQISYYETGGLVQPGGDDGDLLANVDYYSDPQVMEIWRAFVSPKWMAYHTRGIMEYPQWAGEQLSYYAFEASNNINANPEMDSDQADWYVGNVDARSFPSKTPTNYACAAGYQLFSGITYKRDDDWVVTSFELRESYDGRDWNDDGDTSDSVAAYYAIDPNTGKCRDNVVNTGVYGVLPTTSGEIVTPMYTSESGDRRDWNDNGFNGGNRQLYHPVSSTWTMKGPVYTSFTFTASVPSWGFGWWARYEDSTYRPFPLKFGGAFQKYMGMSQGYYHTYFFLTSDEDGDRHTMLPQYHVDIGAPGSTPGGRCILVYVREQYMRYAGIRLMPGVPGDANGDGDYIDTVNYLYCPDDAGGGGEYLLEPTSKFAKGYYIDPIPFIAIGYISFASHGTDSNGLCILSFLNSETELHDDANGNLMIEYGWFFTYYWIWINKSGFGVIPGSVKLIGQSKLGPGGSIMGAFTIINNGGPNIKLDEDRGIDNDKGFKIQGLSVRDGFGPDGVIEPGETATFFFVMVISAGAPIGPMDVKLLIYMAGFVQEETITLSIVPKLYGSSQVCYRHSQDALRTLRAFDMDDDEGMLHNLIPGDVVEVDGQLMTPEDAILLMISWFDNGCGGGNDIQHVHSVSARLTGKHGMGAEYWGFVPGQEEGNEGNGNGGLTGQDRKEVYGF
jgi:hypothetical protein